MWIALGVVVIAAIYRAVAAYNRLVNGRNECENSWGQIDVQLKRRYDLVPNLIETAKGYMKHERETLEAVIKARQMAMDASTVKDQAAAENMLTSTLRSLMAVSGNYPELKADEHMLNVQEEFTSTENRIGFARQHYNDTVLRLNNKVQTVPSNIVASLFGFAEREYFEAGGEARGPVNIEF